jgi:N-acetylmuramoyl-L-alanine amidase
MKGFIEKSLVAAALGFGLLPAASAAVQMRAIDLSAADDSTHVVVELSGRAAHNVLRMSKPERLVIDLRNTVRSPRVKAPGAAGLVAATRFGAKPKRTLRMVFELTSAASATLHWDKPAASSGAKLVIDIRSGAARGAPSPPERAPAAAARLANTAGSPSTPSTPSTVLAAHAPADSGRDIVIAVDAGHGGEDPGATGRNGTREKDVVLRIARALAERINSEPGMRAVLTRDADIFIPLRDRMARARAAKADLFVSVHADAIRDREVSGASVYVLSDRGASSEAARWLAERENAADLKGGVKLDDKDNVLASVLLDLSQTASISASMQAAQCVLASIDHVGVVRKPRVQQAGFVVLKSPDIPSMLIETAYISNPSDERQLQNGTHQQRLAAAIFGGVRAYFDDNAPEGTRLAQRRREGSIVLAGRSGP